MSQIKHAKIELFDSSIELLKHSVAFISNAMPNQIQEITALEFTAMRMFCQTITRSQAIQKLLEEGFISEACIIIRSLMFDTHYLMYLDKHPNRRDALILSLRQQEIRNWEDLLRIADEADVSYDTKEITERIKEESANVQSKMAKLGITKLEKFPGQGAGLARSLGRLSDIVGHKMYSLMTHSAVLNPIAVGIDRNEEDVIELSLQDKNPKLVFGAAYSTSEYLFEAALAISSLQKWNTLEELKTEYKYVVTKFQELERK